MKIPNRNEYYRFDSDDYKEIIIFELRYSDITRAMLDDSLKNQNNEYSFIDFLISRCVLIDGKKPEIGIIDSLEKSTIDMVIKSLSTQLDKFDL